MPEPEGWYKKVVLTFSREVEGKEETTSRSFYYFKPGDVDEAKEMDGLLERAKGYFKEEGWEFKYSQTFFPD